MLMKIGDIEKKLDMKLKLVVKENIDILTMSKLHNINMGIFIKEDKQREGDYYLEAFIIKNSSNLKYRELIESFWPVENDSFFMITRTLYNTKIVSLLKELWTVPSITFSEITVENGEIILRIRFHSLFKKQLSLILNKYLSIPEFIDDMLLVKSEGISLLMAKKNERVPLSIIQFSIPMDIHLEDYAYKMLMEKNGIAEIVENPSHSSDFKVILFLNGHVSEKEGFVCIAKEDNIYEIYEGNQFLNLVKEKADNQGIYRNNIMIKIKNGRIYSTSVLSTNRIMDYMKIVFASSDSLYGKNIVRMENILKFDPEIYSNL
jgi:hypothetical protein